MEMKRIFIVIVATLLTVGYSHAKDDDEVIVTRQLTMGQRNSLPEKTVTVEMKRLTPSKKADRGLIDAITQLMDTIAQEDYLHRTFVLLVEPKGDGEIAIAARNDDIVTRAKQDEALYYGSLEHGRHHFVVLISKENGPLLEQTFKRQGKVRFVQEFEFVDFKTPNYPTNATVRWSPEKGLSWQTVIINEDPRSDREALERPALLQDKD